MYRINKSASSLLISWKISLTSCEWIHGGIISIPGTICSATATKGTNAASNTTGPRLDTCFVRRWRLIRQPWGNTRADSRLFETSNWRLWRMKVEGLFRGLFKVFEWRCWRSWSGGWVCFDAMVVHAAYTNLISSIRSWNNKGNSKFPLHSSIERKTHWLSCLTTSNLWSKL